MPNSGNKWFVMLPCSCQHLQDGPFVHLKRDLVGKSSMNLSWRLQPKKKKKGPHLKKKKWESLTTLMMHNLEGKKKEAQSVPGRSSQLDAFLRFFWTSKKKKSWIHVLYRSKRKEMSYIYFFFKSVWAMLWKGKAHDKCIQHSFIGRFSFQLAEHVNGALNI